MKLIGLMLARNESWILGASLRIALQWCDEMIVLDHNSTDDTAKILNEIGSEHPGRVHVIRETSDGWSEMHHRQLTLEAARDHGATHCAIVDCDEILTANAVPKVRELIEQLPDRGALDVGMPCMWRGLDQYRVGRSTWANRWDLTLAFKDHPSLCWKPINGYEHHARVPFGARVALRGYSLNGGVMHLQFASWRRLTAKHSLYKVHERVTYPSKPVAEIDRLYSLALDEYALQVSDAPSEWWAGYEEYRKHIDLDAVPWHEAECRRLWNVHGPEKFAGLNLFGVVDQRVAA